MLQKRGIVIFLFGLLLNIHANAQHPLPTDHQRQDEYQFSVGLPFMQPNGNAKNTTNYLWIPSSCKKVKAVIISSQNVLEQWLNEHPLIRKVCKENDIAILWSCPGFFIDIKEKSKQVNGKNIQIILDTLGAISGYKELSRVPWISIGHSGTNNLVSELVYHYPNKILTAIKMKGGPGFDLPTTSFILNKEVVESNKYSIPFLCNAGEYFEWNQQNEDLIHPFDTIKNYQSILNERKQKQQPLSYFFDPNTGHFECSEALTALVASYIDAAVKCRLSKLNDTLLIPIDLNKGWVAGLPLPGSALVEPKLYKDAVGVEKNLPWYFNRKQAENAIALAKVNFKRKTQIAGFSNLDGTVAQFNRGIVWPIPYETQADGTTFTLQPVFWKSIPDTFKFAGTVLGKSNNQPKVILLCGNAKPISKNTYKITPERSYKAASTYFIVRTEGDDQYRTSVEPGQIIITPNDKGAMQTITFDTLKNVRPKTKSISLKAIATSNLPVTFFVKAGPAFIKGNQLFFTTIPPSSKFPVKVTVVAYQWGRTQQPQIQTAAFVERTFYINK
jgi:hypothetical protein